jgi:YVTN family beta-propeller protein
MNTAKAGASVSDLMEAVGLTEPISRPAARWRSALQDKAANLQRRYHRHLPQTLRAAEESVDDGPLVEVGAASGFSALAQFAVNDGPIGGIAVSPDGGRVVVTNYGADTVSVIDVDTFAVVETVTGTDEPFAIAMGSATYNRAYVSTVSPTYDSIVAVDLSTTTVVATHPVARSVSDLAVSPSGKHVYASRTGSDGADVAVLDTMTGRIDAIDIAVAPGTTAKCLSISPDGQRLYAATHGQSGGELVVIDTRAQHVIDTIEIGSAIRDVALSPDGAMAYVASCDSDSGAVVDIIDTGTHLVTGTCEIGEINGLVMQLALSGDGERAYLVNDGGVMVMCTLTHDVLGTITVDARPSCVIESPDGNFLYVADYAGGVTVVSIASSAASPVARTVGDEIIAELDLLQLDPALT